MTMTTAPTIQMMLFMKLASRLGQGSNRLQKAIHYTGVFTLPFRTRMFRAPARICFAHKFEVGFARSNDALV